MLNYLAIWTLNRDWQPGAPSRTARTRAWCRARASRPRDGWLVIMCMKEKFWERLVERHGAAGAGATTRASATFADRLAHRDALVPLLEAEFRRRTTAEWLERLRGHVPVAPVYTVAEALADEQVLAREMVVEVEHPVFGALREVGCPIKIDGVAPRYAPGAAARRGHRRRSCRGGVAPTSCRRCGAGALAPTKRARARIVDPPPGLSHGSVQ